MLTWGFGIRSEWLRLCVYYCEADLYIFIFLFIMLYIYLGTVNLGNV